MSGEPKPDLTGYVRARCKPCPHDDRYACIDCLQELRRHLGHAERYLKGRVYRMMRYGDRAFLKEFNEDWFPPEEADGG